MTAKEHLDLAKRHLERVLVAWDPPDWDDLSLYGFYCLESAVSAAAVHAGIRVQPNHRAKAEAARDLASRHGLPDVSGLLRDLNDARKSAAYGDTPHPDLDAEDVATQVKDYVKTVGEYLGY